MDSAAARIDGIFAAFDVPGSPGAAVGVMQHGELVEARGYGLADIEHGVPITPVTVFNIGSMAKQFTAFGIALLAAEGALGLDDDIRTHLPDLADFGAVVTIRHLVHHMSGMRGTYPELLGLAGWRLEDRITNDDAYRLLTRQRELNFVPGTEYQYVNSNYVLLARICERVSGQSFADFSRVRIFEPLGMERSVILDSPGKLIAGKARGYYGDADSGWVHAPLTDSVQGPTNVYTTVTDLAKWDRNLATGAVGGRDVADLMVTPGVRGDGTVTDYAFGLEVGPTHRHRGRDLVEHGGQHGGYFSWMVRFPAEGLSVAVLCNHFSWETRSYALAVADCFLAGDRPPPDAGDAGTKPPPAAGSLPAGSERYCGTYFDPIRAGVRVVDIASGRLRFEGYDLTPNGDAEFVIDVEPAVRVGFIGDAGADPAAMETDTPSGIYRYDRVSAAPQEPDLLAGYAGRYTCPELGVTWSVAASDTGLSVRRPRYPDTAPAPVFADAFRDDWEPVFGFPYSFLLLFDRTDDGAVSGFRLSGDRVRHLRYFRE